MTPTATDMGESASEARPLPMVVTPSPTGVPQPRVSLDTEIGNSPSGGGPKQRLTLRQWLMLDNRTPQHRARQLALRLIEQQHADLTSATPPVDEGMVERATEAIQNATHVILDTAIARCMARAAIAAAPPDDRLRVAREALTELADAYEMWTKQGASLVPLRQARESLATLGEPAQSGEGK